MRRAPVHGDFVLWLTLVGSICACSSPSVVGQDAGFDALSIDVRWVDAQGDDAGMSDGDADHPDASINMSDASVPLSDGGSSTDAGAPSEAGVPPDGGVPSEAGVPPDGGVPRDAGVDADPTDSGLDSATDSGVVTPAGCADGTFDDDDDPMTACQAWSECEAGEYVRREGSAFADQECAGCESGTYSVVNDAASCSDWTDCRRGYFVLSEGSFTVDRSCARCPEGRYSSGYNQAQCLELELCSAGTVQTRAGTPARPPRCAECVTGEFCAGAELPRLPCVSSTWDHDADPATSCAQWTECVPGTYVLEAGDARHDRLCEGCSAGTFSSESNSAECEPWRTCPPGEVPTSGTASRDRDCIPIMEM